jgi:Protein of unknown function (DUF2490)
MKSKNYFRAIQNLEFSPKTAVPSRMKPAVKLIFCLTFICLAIAGRAQGQPAARQVVNQQVQWSFLSSTIKLKPNYSLFVEEQVGLVEFKNMQHVLRAGFDYAVTKKLSVMPIAYAYTWNYLYGKQPASFVNNERTVWQQIVYRQHISRVAVNHRLRFEERFIQTHSMGSNDEVVSNGFNNKQFRIRYRAFVNIPLNHKTIEPKTYYISIWDEIFMSWGKAVTFHKPDQNRVFVGPGYQFTKNLAVQGGFFYQMLIKSNGARQENNTGLLLQVNYNLDLSKK